MNAQIVLTDTQKTQLVQLTKLANSLAHNTNDPQAARLYRFLQNGMYDNRTERRSLLTIKALCYEISFMQGYALIEQIEKQPVVIDNTKDHQYETHDQYGYGLIPDSELPF